MTIISAIPDGSPDAYARLVEGLRTRLGCSNIAALGERIFKAEKADFHRVVCLRERYLGRYFGVDFGDQDAGENMARIANLRFLAGRWHAGVCLVDGNACAVDLLWLRSFDRHDQATFARAH